MTRRGDAGRRRRIMGTAALTAAAGLLGAGAGTAAADEHHRDSHNAPRVYLFQVGQIDDPAEDVLEHVLLVGDGYTWD